MTVPVTAVIAVRFADGTVGRVQYYNNETDLEIQAALAKTRFSAQHGAVLGWRRVTFADFPTQHHDFRAAWRDAGSAITVDMPAAREVWRQTMRRAREPLLRDLDGQYLRAIERGDMAAQTAIANQKQTLRDVTADPSIDAAKTPDELRAVWPAALGAKPA